MRACGVLWLTCGLSACAQTAHFPDAPIVWRDNDDAPSPLPHRKTLEINWLGARDAVFNPADHFFALDYGREAGNINALDDVPDSSWYEDPRRRDSAGNILVQPRALTAEEMTDGAAAGEEPPAPPLTILHGKVGGATAGLVVEDARGRRYALKLDPVDHTGLITSTELVASRLAWASGWRVPKELLIDVCPADLRLAPTAWTLDQWSKHIPLTAELLATTLKHSGHEADGSIRVLASRWIEGDILGWFSYLGRDHGDLNDLTPHEDRRDLRGFGVWAAWVNDIDTFENNTLDSYVGKPGEGHVVHYQQDVGGSFGVFADGPQSPWMSLDSYFDVPRIFASSLTLGLSSQPWMSAKTRHARERQTVEWPEIGPFDADHFDPRAWKTTLDNPAFVRQTARDRYWGAKRVIAFSRDEVTAAVAAGNYRPAAATRLVNVLWERRNRIARAYLSEVASIDYFRVDGDLLCFDDLWLTAELGTSQGSEYRARNLSTGHTRADLVVDPQSRCLPLPSNSGYQIIEIRTRHLGQRRFDRSVQVHLVDRRIVGIMR